MYKVIKNLLRWANITKSGNSASEYPVQQVTYLGKVADSVVIFPYGMFANVPVDNLMLMFSLYGHEENRAGIPITSSRPTLEPGEIAIFNSLTGSNIILKSDGSIEINATDGLNINGNVSIQGLLTNNGVDVGSTHVHSGVTSGGSTSGPPV